MNFLNYITFQACPVDKISNFVPTETKPSTQLIIDCDEGGVAQKAGLQAGDFIIEVGEFLPSTPNYQLSFKLAPRE